LWESWILKNHWTLDERLHRFDDPLDIANIQNRFIFLNYRRAAIQPLERSLASTPRAATSTPWAA
jgi:hypothetical protein